MPTTSLYGSSQLAVDQVQSSTSDTEIAQLFNEIPQVMEFESWWTESGQRRYMLILYYPPKEVFEVMVDDSIVPLKVAVFARNGKPLKAWDLHVGAVVDILGKPTTLMKAKYSTMQWLDTQAKRLWTKKVKLENQLSKFRILPKLTPLEGVTVKKLEGNCAGTIGGSVNLGKLALTVTYLQNELKVFKGA
eukprot:Sspe_Gene.77971::Locus_48754_Transcript_1_1_Confidence_1.000_Length_712::g.77971::m.77971